jgi:hypothetical protein
MLFQVLIHYKIAFSAGARGTLQRTDLWYPWSPNRIQAMMTTKTELNIRSRLVAMLLKSDVDILPYH